MPESEIRMLMEAANTDANGTLDCDEFVTVSLHLKKMTNDEYLASAFSYFDKDGSGFIELEELRRSWGPMSRSSSTSSATSTPTRTAASATRSLSS